MVHHIHTRYGRTLWTASKATLDCSTARIGDVKVSDKIGICFRGKCRTYVAIRQRVTNENRPLSQNLSKTLTAQKSCGQCDIFFGGFQVTFSSSCSSSCSKKRSCCRHRHCQISRKDAIDMASSNCSKNFCLKDLLRTMLLDDDDDVVVVVLCLVVARWWRTTNRYWVRISPSEMKSCQKASDEVHLDRKSSRWDRFFVRTDRKINRNVRFVSQ